MRKYTVRLRGLGLVVAIVMGLLVSSLTTGSALASSVGSTAFAAATTGEPAPVPAVFDRGGTASDEFVISSTARWVYRYAATGEFIDKIGVPVSTQNALQVDLIARSWDDGREEPVTLVFTNAPVSPIAADTVTFAVGECSSRSFRPVWVNFTNTSDDAANSGPSKDRIVVIADSPSSGRWHWDASHMGRWDDGQSRSIAVHSDYGNVLNYTVGYYPGTYQVRIFANGDMVTPVATGVVKVDGCGVENPNKDEATPPPVPSVDKPNATLTWLKGGRLYLVKLARPVAGSVLRYKVVVRQAGAAPLKKEFVVRAGSGFAVKRVRTAGLSPNRPRKGVVSVKVLSRWKPLQKVVYRG